mmetsp:Transcript_23575/g.33752  ORF Transcript_23575/g.33752 Transcript_23575/m.33752 type:complete len:130 (+) Transcript_23575:116-505(+)
MSGIFSFTSGIFSSGNEKLLIKASKDGNLKEVQRLLDKRVSPNVVDESGCTPLHLAAIKGHQEAVRQLLAGGAQTEAVDTYGDTPLHVAARGGHQEVVSLLLAGGAQIEAVNKVRRMVGRWAIDGGGIA